MTLDVMAKVLLLATALLATPLAALAGASTPEAASSGAAHGKALYQQYCASCHGLNGHGEFN